MTFRIRAARPSDAAALADLAARTFSETFAHSTTDADMAAYLVSHYSEAQQCAEIDDPRTTTLVVDDGTVLVAYAQLRDNDPAPEILSSGHLAIGSSSHHETAIELVRFYVDQPWHGQGVAPELMAACVSAARDRGATVMWLGVWEHNGRAQAFYRKHGFDVVGSHIFMLGSDAQTDLIMRKET